jgi:hypothetical protein
MPRSRRRSVSWKPGTQRAPKFATIVVSALLVLVGVMLTFGLPTLSDVLRLPSGLAETLEWGGIAAYVAATILMLLGIFLEGL